MTYHFTKQVDMSFDEAVAATTESLKNNGFGVLTEINVKETLKKKLDVDFHHYLILGACNPQMAYQALQHENKIGTMLPCNVVVQQHNDGKVEISAIDPIASMQAISNPALGEVATKVRAMLEKVVADI